MFPMGIVTQRMTQGRWRSKLFTSSTTWTVPADVGCIWVDGCGGGGGGSGGYGGIGGGGGGGGTAGLCVTAQIVPVTPSGTLTITIGAAGTGGAVGAHGVAGGTSSIYVGADALVSLSGGATGGVGTATEGGDSIGFGSLATGASTGSGNNAARLLAWFTSGVSGNNYFPGNCSQITSGGGGGGPASNGGGVFLGSVVCKRIVGSWPNSALYLPGGTGNATGGGGGAGGQGLWSVGQLGSGPYMRAGEGGDGGQAGFDAHPDSFGSGGGGGGGNAAGGNGSPGMLRIYCLTAYDI